MSLLTAKHYAPAVFTFPQIRLPTAGLALCCLTIAGVSVHDAMLLVLNHETIGEDELNPLGRMLLEMNGGAVWLFVLVKLLGTAMVCAFLIEIFRCQPRIALASAGVITGLQVLLLLYLCFA